MAKKSTPSPGNSVAQPYKPSAAEKKAQMRYQAEDAIRTLTRADEIKKDAKLMSHVKNHVETMKKVCK